MSVPGVELVGRQNACRVDLENRSRDWIVNLDDLNVHFGDAPPRVRKEHVEFWSSRDFPARARDVVTLGSCFPQRQVEREQGGILVR